MRRVVCISRDLGAGGEEIGRLVADRLGLRYVDEEVIERAAEKGGVAPEDLTDVEQRKSRFRRVLEFVGDSGAGSGAVAPETVLRTQREESHRTLIRDVIAEMARDGDAVIVAHAASFAVGDGEGILRVLVTASTETRSKRLAEENEIGQMRAAQLVRESEAARAEYVKRFYGIDREEPTHYDLVVNTDVLTPQTAADIVERAAGVL
jgi:cytidylate kinase